MQMGDGVREEVCGLRGDVQEFMEELLTRRDRNAGPTVPPRQGILLVPQGPNPPSGFFDPAANVSIDVQPPQFEPGSDANDRPQHQLMDYGAHWNRTTQQQPYASTSQHQGTNLPSTSNYSFPAPDGSSAPLTSYTYMNDDQFREFQEGFQK